MELGLGKCSIHLFFTILFGSNNNNNNDNGNHNDNDNLRSTYPMKKT